MKAVFLDSQTFLSEVSLENIKQQVTELTCYDLTPSELVIERCISADIIITNKVVIDESLLSQLPKLKLICIAATGTNNIDIQAAKAGGVAVCNVSGYSKSSVVQYVFSQLLDYFSAPKHHQHNVEQGLWQQSPSFCFHGNGSAELAGKTISIIGFGDLGEGVANVAKAFGMQVLIAERPNVKTCRAGRVSFEHALQQADIVSLHCPLTDDTENLIGTAALKLMKSSAVLINASRGKVVDEHALLSALNSHDIAYAILDVLAQEPPAKDYFLLTQQPKNLKITAHIAWASIESQQRLLNLIATNIEHFKQDISTNRVDNI